MASPFPGMDPYLETPRLWSDLHHSLVTYVRDALAPGVSPHYRVRIEERVYVSEPARIVRPDVAFIERPVPDFVREPAAGGVAVAERVDAPTVITIPSEPIHEAYLEIVDLRGGRVVTVIEVLSPANKAPGAGRDSYLEKQRQVLASDANLVEIDLLRGGMHTAAVPGDSLVDLPPYHYLVCVSRAGYRSSYEVYHTTVQEPLPHPRIPLRRGDADIRLDLPGVLARAYENGRYADEIDYTRDPDPPFGGELAAWVRATARGETAQAGKENEGETQ